MRRPFQLLAIVLLSLSLLGAGGGGEGDHTNPVKDLIFLWINFLLVLGVLFYFGREPVREFFKTRRSELKGEMDQAKALLSEAERRNSEWQRRVADLDSELDEIRKTARQRAQDERAGILAEAHEAAERIQRDALAAVEQEARRASSELRAEAARLASEMAARIVSERIGQADQDRLIDEFISHIDSGARS